MNITKNTDITQIENADDNTNIIYAINTKENSVLSDSTKNMNKGKRSMPKKNTPKVTPITTEGAQVMKKCSTPTEDPSEILTSEQVSEASPIEATTQPLRTSKTASCQAPVVKIQAPDIPDTTEAEITGEMEASLDDVKPVSREGENQFAPPTSDSLDIPMVEISEVATYEPVSYEVVIPPEKARVLGPHFNAARISQHKALLRQDTDCFLTHGQYHYEDWLALKAYQPRGKTKDLNEYWSYFVADILGIEIRSAQIQRDVYRLYCLGNPSKPEEQPLNRDYLLKVGVTKLHHARTLHNAKEKNSDLTKEGQGITDFCLDRPNSKIMIKFSFNIGDELKAGEWIDFADPKLKVRTLREWMPQAASSTNDSGDSLEAKNRELRKKYKDAEREIKELKANNEDLRMELAKTQANLQDIEEEKDRWQSKYIDLVEKYESLRKIDEDEVYIHEYVPIV